MGDGPVAAAECEKAILGAMMIPGSGDVEIVRSLLRADDFYYEPCRVVFDAICESVDAGAGSNMATVADRMSQAGTFDGAGGANMFGELAECMVLAYDLESFCHTVLEKSLTRKAIRRADTFIETARANGHSLNEMVSDFEGELRDIGSRTKSRTPSVQRIGDVLQGVIGQVEAWQKPEYDWRSETIQTGIGTIDDTLAGLKRGDMSIVKAIRSHGKTALGVQCAHYAIDDRKRVIFVTAEMSAGAITLRFISIRCGIPVNDLMTRQLTEQQWGGVMEAFAGIDSAPLRIQQENSSDIGAILPPLERAIRDEPPMLVVVDYLQKLSHQESDTQERAMSHISNTLKDMAMANNCHVMLLAQVNDAGDVRWTKEAGDAADVVLRIKKERAGDSNGTLEIEKNRNGPTAFTEFTWNGSRGLFTQQV